MISKEITKEIAAIGELMHKVEKPHADFLRIIRQNLSNIVKDVVELESRIVCSNLNQ